jgi:hypothetical protein
MGINLLKRHALFVLGTGRIDLGLASPRVFASRLATARTPHSLWTRPDDPQRRRCAPHRRFVVRHWLRQSKYGFLSMRDTAFV